jgi:hypothetical protein
MKLRERDIITENSIRWFSTYPERVSTILALSLLSFESNHLITTIILLQFQPITLLLRIILTIGGSSYNHDAPDDDDDDENRKEVYDRSIPVNILNRLGS